MTDIARRLRNHVVLQYEAAAEIERLRAALQEIADNPCMDPEGNAQEARRALAGNESSQ